MLHSEVYEAAAEAVTVAPRRAARARAAGNREVGRLELEEPQGGDDGFLADVELTPRGRHPSEFDDDDEEEISLLNELEPSPREREARREAGLPMRRWRHRQRGTPLRVKIWLIALVLTLGAFAASGAALAPRVAAWLGGGSTVVRNLFKVCTVVNSLFLCPALLAMCISVEVPAKRPMAPLAHGPMCMCP